MIFVHLHYFTFLAPRKLSTTFYNKLSLTPSPIILLTQNYSRVYPFVVPESKPSQKNKNKGGVERLNILVLCIRNFTVYDVNVYFVVKCLFDMDPSFFP